MEEKVRALCMVSLADWWSTRQKALASLQAQAADDEESSCSSESECDTVSGSSAFSSHVDECNLVPQLLPLPSSLSDA